MTRADLLARTPDWVDQPLWARIDACASVLYCHGYITEKIRERIAKELGEECELARAEKSA